MPRTKKPAGPAPADADTEIADAVEQDPEAEAEDEPEVEPDPEAIVAVEAEAEEEEETEVEVEVAPEEIAAAAVADDDDLDDEVEIEKPVVAARPAGRPAPGRPPGAKEEPDPPYYVGERVKLIANTRPRTGVSIGDYPVGAQARVETVLSLTCIVRFDVASDTKEVVAFQNLESIDAEAQARRAERDKLKKAAEKAAEKEAAEKA